MNKRTMLAATLAAAAAFSGMTAVHADIKVVSSLSVDNPMLEKMLQSMPASRKDMLTSMGIGSPLSITTYVSGDHVRIETGQTSIVLVDNSSHQMTTLNTIAHTYFTTNVDSSASKASEQSDVKVTDTGDTKTIVGHLCHKYHVVGGKDSESALGGAMTGDIWAASDLLGLPPGVSFSGPMSALTSGSNAIKGMPLELDFTVTGGKMGTTNVTMTTQSIDSSSVPSTLFAIPDGYTKQDSPTMPSMPH